VENIVPRRPILFGGLLVLIGLALGIGGSWLAVLGGSIYYLLAGLLVAASGVLLARDSAWGDNLYAIMLAMTGAWSLWEVGFSFWGLMPRLAGPAVLGLWLFTPAVRRGVDAGRYRPGGMIALLAIALLAVVALRPGPSPVGAASPVVAGENPPDSDWTNYGNTLHGTRFSPLSQITPANVSALQVAWIHRSGDVPDAVGSNEATPLKVGDTLYTCTPQSLVIAIDARSGAERWRVDPHLRPGQYAHKTCRGVSYYHKPDGAGPCADRIFMPTADAKLLALDAQTGQGCPDFGDGGAISLLDGLGAGSLGGQYTTSPPAVVGDHVVLGGFVLDNQSTDMPSGVIRSFDPVTGRLQWAWDMGAPDRIGAPPPGESYTRSTPNAWTVLAADAALGLVYVPTGNASPDSFGAGRRPFDEKYSSSLVALDIDTGRPRWSFQAVHHDLWDYDMPAQPVLVDLPKGQDMVPAVVQATKQGDIYVLDRRTGVPIVPVTERPVPQGAASGDRLSPTQPFSALSLTPKPLSEAAMWGLTPIDQMICRILFRQSRYDGIYTPPGLKHTIQQPGLTGTMNWGSVSVDEDRRIVIANSMSFPWRVRLIPRTEISPANETARWSPMMRGTPYAWGQSPFWSPLQVPCIQPPWGSLTAIDLATDRVLWSRPLGSGRDSGPLGMATMLPIPIGVPSLGGTVVTRGGLIFVSGTLDRYVRAFDLNTGREVWKARLPAGGQATPMTYMSGGRQFVVVTAGGHSIMGTMPGDYTIAYALPQR